MATNWPFVISGSRARNNRELYKVYKGPCLLSGSITIDLMNEIVRKLS